MYGMFMGVASPVIIESLCSISCSHPYILHFHARLKLVLDERVSTRCPHHSCCHGACCHGTSLVPVFVGITIPHCKETVCIVRFFSLSSIFPLRCNTQVCIVRFLYHKLWGISSRLLYNSGKAQFPRSQRFCQILSSVRQSISGFFLVMCSACTLHLSVCSPFHVHTSSVMCRRVV